MTDWAASALERRLRANAAFELVLFDRLPAGERRLLAGMARDPEHYGVLRPRPGSGLGLKAVDRETALLFLTLARPGPLPGYVRSRLGDAAAVAALARLVADGVLEIEREPGLYLSGGAALPLLVEAPPAGGATAGGATGGDATAGGAAAEVAATGGGRLARLSLAALRYGEDRARLEADPLRLSLRLYLYHRLPVTPHWRRTLPTQAAVRRYLGIGAGGACQGLLDRHWREQGADADAAWLHWRAARPVAAATPGAGDGATYKLYVSPASEALPEVFGRLLDGLAAAGAPALKVGAGAGGLLRPDKVVVYFGTFERLAEAAAAVGERLAGTAAHGVPFTSEIGGGGLLSWGVDPPPAAGVGVPTLPWSDGRQSWRLWLTHRLARALIAGVAAEGRGAEGSAAGGTAAAMEPWRFAVERLRLDGVDTASWTPGGRLWSRGQGAWL